MIYQIENLMNEQKDKISDEDKEDAEKSHIDAEIERIQNQFQELYQKYQVQPTPDQPQN